ncbi:DUF2924 domain-containing protein [Marimonas lutisalis]|uniref:DUF2924 domain-containing protein n=1 Tax=Marimonas lutisalis TaxID=2545756 RepID=UPI0010F6EDEA|nr:DUF2924 domain-containing protein [Marimonas lutisalis]
MRSATSSPEIQRLEGASAATLRQLWAEARGVAPPKTFTARLMRLALAWQAQVGMEGAEPAKARRDWNRIIKEREAGAAKGTAGKVLAPIVHDGTRLLKDWGGATHEVLVTEGGAVWNGQSYTSLSAVARAMTGTNRNGPKFFGLREGGMQ